MKVIDGKEVLDDGEVLIVRTRLMDHATVGVPVSRSPRGLQQPGSLPMTDADRARRAAMVATKDKMLSDRWKHPAEPAATAAALANNDVYARRDKRLSERWKGPK
jgi:hypothetical protein